MFEPRDDVESRRLCRIYVRLFDTGPAGASLAPMDARGPADLLHRHGTDDAGLVQRLLEDGLLDRVPVGAPADHAAADAVLRRLRELRVVHGPMLDRPLDYALPPDPRSRMTVPMGAIKPLGDQIREDLARHDRGERVPAEHWIRHEASVRAAYLPCEPL